jgi:hypothetical protein
MRTNISLALAPAFAAPVFATEAGEIVISDFEAPDYGAWKVEGAAFGKGPPRGALPGQMGVAGSVGQGLGMISLSSDCGAMTILSLTVHEATSARPAVVPCQSGGSFTPGRPERIAKGIPLSNALYSPVSQVPPASANQGKSVH